MCIDSFSGTSYRTKWEVVKVRIARVIAGATLTRPRNFLRSENLKRLKSGKIAFLRGGGCFQKTCQYVRPWFGVF